jgi:hypothetical protein
LAASNVNHGDRNGGPPSVNTLIHVRISPTIELDFVRRNVFPELRTTVASSVSKSKPDVYAVILARAREILVDAEAHRYNSESPRGTAMAYNSLIEKLHRAIRTEERRGLFEDPGYDEAAVRMNQSPARLQIGDSVLHFHTGGECGEPAVIIKPYSVYKVLSQDGAFFAVDGTRLDYAPGYVISIRGSQETFFCPAHRLTREDCKPGHLRLVAPRTE